MNLGFGASDPSIGARLPARFLGRQTTATGIDMQSFYRGNPELGRFMVGRENSVGKLGVWNM